MQVKSAAKYMAGAFPNALELESVFVLGGALDALEDAVDECVNAETWVEVGQGGGKFNFVFVK